jgi:hypothetical protein
MVESEFERATMRKIMRRFVPVLFVSCLVALLDRTNVGFAALTMNTDLGLSSAAFGFGAGVFFVTYMLFEVPSNPALERFGARRWIARIMFTWGLLAGATAFVQGEYSFYAVRLLLGAAEAGFVPSVFFFFTLWIPSGCTRARGFHSRRAGSERYWLADIGATDAAERACGAQGLAVDVPHRGAPGTLADARDSQGAQQAQRCFMAYRAGAGLAD